MYLVDVDLDLVDTDILLDLPERFVFVFKI